MYNRTGQVAMKQPFPNCTLFSLNTETARLCTGIRHCVHTHTHFCTCRWEESLTTTTQSVPGLASLSQAVCSAQTAE
uniref:Uncharacterized protein n=1 Tax=Ixodes ricinus TaxID=34613 RepID=A0A0K8R6E9_IXORI